jgi:hypothetical protein
MRNQTSAWLSWTLQKLTVQKARRVAKAALVARRDALLLDPEYQRLKAKYSKARKAVTEHFANQPRDTVQS